MTWRLQSWSPDHFSKVIMTMKQGSDATELTLLQESVPIGQKSATEENWKNYYFNSIKRTFGFGVIL
jgi:activator of HSP90 ATPase